MQTYYPYFLAIHIIFIVTWFSGLFYIVRLYIYHAEALQKEEPHRSILADQYALMEKRLMNIITTPSMILVLITGITLLSIQPVFLQQGWMHAKLFFVLCVVGYHFYCMRIQKQLASGNSGFSSLRLRMLNELSTIFLVAIVFLAVLKDLVGFLWGICGLFALMLLLMIAIRLYKKRREKN